VWSGRIEWGLSEKCVAFERQVRRVCILLQSSNTSGRFSRNVRQLTLSHSGDERSKTLRNVYAILVHCMLSQPRLQQHFSSGNLFYTLSFILDACDVIQLEVLYIILYNVRQLKLYYFVYYRLRSKRELISIESNQ